MKDEYHNYIGCALFFLFIVFIVLLGSITLYLNNKEKINVTSTNGSVVIQSDKKKNDKDKDFVYYTDEVEKSDLTYKKAVINISSDDAVSVNTILSDIYDEALNSIVLATEDNTCENEDSIKSSSLIDYAVYENSKYVTLLITISNYSCGNSVVSKLVSYTFDITTGNLLSFDDLLKEYNLNYTEVLNKINSNLEENQTDDYIKIDDTLNELKENNTYVVYISNEGSLVVKYIVKTTLTDYNDVIEFN
jgi:hypothetical protein